MRKQLQAEHGKADLEKRIAELEAKRTKQENKVVELKSKIDAIEKRNSERKEVEAKKREEEIKFLKYQETHLQKFLKNVDNKWQRLVSNLRLYFFLIVHLIQTCIHQKRGHLILVDLALATLS